MKKKLVLSALILLVGSSLFITGKKNFSKEIVIEDLENSKSIAIYIKDENGNYNKTNSIPTSGYTLNTTKSVCTNNAKPSWNINTNSLKISNLTSNNTGCYLYFDKLEGLALEMANAKPSPEGFTGIADTDEGMYYAEDDDGTTYYYRGAVEDNWFKFANLYWRIIRVNGDGSIRLIYNGPTTDQTGETTQIEKNTYNGIVDDETTYKDNAYVGFMYGTVGSTTYVATHANTNNSTILGTTTDTTTLLGWYKTNIVDTKYDEYVSKEAGFCNDRKISTVTGSGYGKLGYGTNATAYAPTDRVFNASWLTTQTPSFKCSQASSDLFTATNSTKGNKKLTYPVGLITMDEAIFAGGFGGKSNSSYYLYTNQVYWTMSPGDYDGVAGVFVVFSDGSFYFPPVYNTLGVRPVINLASDVKLTGSGTVDSPYEIEEA